MDETKDRTEWKGTSGEATWSAVLLNSEIVLLEEGLSPLMVRPDALTYFRPISEEVI